MQVIPKGKTRDKKDDRIVLSMTEKEAYALMTDLVFLKRKLRETTASRSCILNLKKYFDGKMIMATHGGVIND